MVGRRPNKDQNLVVIRITARTYSSSDGSHLIMKTSYAPEMSVEVAGDTPAQLVERFGHALEEEAQRKIGGTWLAVVTTDDPFKILPVTLSPEFALLPLDALARAMGHGLPQADGDLPS